MVWSMTELLLLGRIIYHWRDTLTVAQKFFTGALLFPWRLWTPDISQSYIGYSHKCLSWPSTFVYTWHVCYRGSIQMGTTIGINTMLCARICIDYCLWNTTRNQSVQFMDSRRFWLQLWTVDLLDFIHRGRYVQIAMANGCQSSLFRQ